jgi:hypothetical protein
MSSGGSLYFVLLTHILGLQRLCTDHPTVGNCLSQSIVKFMSVRVGETVETHLFSLYRALLSSRYGVSSIAHRAAIGVCRCDIDERTRECIAFRSRYPTMWNVF